MQNIDFSRKIRRPETPRLDEHTPRPQGGELRKTNRIWAFAGAACIIAFTLGILAGIQIKSIKTFEDSVASRPDERRSGTQARDSESLESFANRGENDPPLNPPAARGTGGFIIKIGTFETQKSERLTSMLNGVPELGQTRPLMCKNVNEAVPDRYLAFRTRVNDTTGRQNVFLGCFADRESARTALRFALASGIEGVSGARIFEIE